MKEGRLALSMDIIQIDIGMKQRPVSIEYSRKSAQPQQVRQIAVDSFTEVDSPEYLRRPEGLVSPFASHIKDIEDVKQPDTIDDLYRRITGLLQSTQTRLISISLSKSLTDAEVKGKVLDDFAQLSNAIWDTLYRHRSLTETSPQPRDWMRKLLKLEDEKRSLESHARVTIEHATEALQDKLSSLETEITTLRETNAFLHQQNSHLSEQITGKSKPKDTGLKGSRLGVRRLERDLNESIPKALAIARDLSLDSSVSSGDVKHRRQISTGKDPKIAPVTKKHTENRSISPSDRQIHQLKSELERIRSQYQKCQQEKDRLSAWKESYVRNPPQLTSALQQIEQETEHEHKKLVGKALILQHKLNAIQLGAQKFVRVSSGLLRFARDREVVSQFEDARAELDVLLREVQREGKSNYASSGATPTSGSPSRFSSPIHTPEKHPEPNRYLRSLEKENRRLEDQLLTERKRADAFAEALEMTQREVESLHGSSISPVQFLRQQEHTIAQLRSHLKASSEAKTAETDTSKRLHETTEQLKRAQDQVQVLRTSNNSLVQDLVTMKRDFITAKDSFQTEIHRILTEIDSKLEIINSKFNEKNTAFSRFKQTVFQRLRKYEASLLRLNSLFPSPTKEKLSQNEEIEHLEYLLQRSEDLKAAKEEELQVFIDQQEGIIANLRREIEENRENGSQIAVLKEKIAKLEMNLAENQEISAENRKLTDELNTFSSKLQQKEAFCNQLTYEKDKLEAANAILMDESRQKSEEILQIQLNSQQIMTELEKKIEFLNESLKIAQNAEKKNAAVLMQKKEKLKANRSQSSEESAKLAQELLNLEEKMKEIEGKNEDLVRIVKEKEEEVEKLRGVIGEYQEEADRERVTSSRLTSELSAVRVTLEEYSRKNEMLGKDKAGLKEALETLKMRHETASREREEQMREVVSGLSQNQSRIKELEEDIALVLQERDTACQELEAAVGKAQETAEALQHLQQDYDSVQSQLQASLTRLPLLESQLHEASLSNSSLHQSNLTFQSTIDRLHSDIQRLSLENTSQKDRLDHLHSELLSAQKDKSLTSLVTSLQRDLEDSRQEIQELKEIKQVKEEAYHKALMEAKKDLEQSEEMRKGLKNEQEIKEKTHLEEENRLKIEINRLKSEQETLKLHLISEKSDFEAKTTQLNTEIFAFQSNITKNDLKITQLTTELHQIQDKNAVLISEKEKLERDMDKINQILKEISAVSETAEREIEQIKGENAKLNGKLSEKEREIGKLVKEMEELKGNKGELEGIVGVLQEGKTVLERENENLQVEIEKIAKNMKNAEKQTEKLLKDLEKMTINRDLLITELAELKLLSKNDREQLEFRVSHLEKELKSLELTHSDCLIDLNSTHDRLQSLNSALNLEKSSLIQLQNDKIDLEEQVKSLNKRLQEAFKQLEIETLEKTSQGDQTAVLRQNLVKMQEKVADLQLNFDAKNRDLELIQLQFNEKMTENRLKTADLEQEKNEFLDKISGLNLEIKHLKSDLESKENEIKSLNRKIQTANSHFESLENGLKTQIEQIKTTVQNYEEKCKNLQNECEELQIKIKEFDEKTRKISAEKENLQGKNEKLLQTLGVLRRENSEEIENLREEVKNVENERKTFFLRIENLEKDLLNWKNSKIDAENELVRVKNEFLTEKTALQSEISSQKSNLQSVLDEFEAKKRQFREQNAKFTENLEKVNKENAFLSVEKQEISEKLKIFTAKCEEMEREKQAILQNIGIIRRENGENVDNLQKNIKNLQENIVEKEIKIEEMRENMEKLEKKVAEKEKILSEKTQEIAKTQEKLSISNSKLLEMETELKTSKNTEIQLNSAKTTLENQLKSLNERLKSAFEQFETQSKEKGDQTSLLRQNLVEISQKMTDLEEKLEQKNEVLRGMEEEKMRLKREIEELKERILRLNEVLEKTETLLSSEKTKNKEISEELHEEKSEKNEILKRLEEENRKKEEIKADLERKKLDIKALNDQLTAKKQEFESEFSRFSTEKRNLESKFTDLEAVFLSTKQQNSEKITELNDEISKEKREKEILESELKKTENKLKNAESEFESEKKTAEMEISRVILEKKSLENAILAFENEIKEIKSENTQLNSELLEFKSKNHSLELQISSLSTELSSFTVQISKVNEVKHYLEAENSQLEKQIAELTESKENFEKLTQEQEAEIGRLVEEIRKLNSGDAEESGRLFGSSLREENLGNLSGLGAMEEEKMSDSLDLGEEYEDRRRDTVEEPLESDPPIRVEGEEEAPERLVLSEVNSLLEAYSNPQDDLVTTVRKLLEEYDLLKRNPSRNVIPRLNLRSHRESKESQTSPRDDFSQSEEPKGSSNADSASVDLDKSVGGSEAADQDTPRQKILPELWMKPVAHKIRQAKGDEVNALRGRVKTLEQEIQEKKTISEHLDMQNRLLKEEVAEKTRHIKRLEVAETAGEKSPVNIEHLKDVLVKLIMQLPKQSSNAENLINTIYSIIFLTSKDIGLIEAARKGAKKGLLGLFR